MTNFHVFEIGTTEPGDVDRTTFTYEIRAEDGRPVPHVFPLAWDASIICDVLNAFQSDAGRLLPLPLPVSKKGCP